MYINRDIENVIIKAFKGFPAVVVTGPRQSGKSTILKKIFAKTHKYITFDDPLIRERAISDPKLFINTMGEYVIYDEIQYVPQLISYIKMEIDRKRNVNGRFIITGSQQFNLIKNLGDSLAGRVAIFELLPFSYNEIKKIKSLKKVTSKTKDIFVHSCLRGSYPQINVRKSIDVNQWFSGYFQTYLERDIKNIYDIGSLRDFQRFMQLLASRCSQLLSLSALSADLGIAVNTVKRWISILEACRIIYLLNPYYNNLGKRITKSPKVYFIDSGIVCYLTGITNENILLNGPLSGPLFENYCIQETVKQIINNNKNYRLYYMRTHNNMEIDLIVTKGMDLFPCEIKLSMTLGLKDARNIIRMKKTFCDLNIKTGRIISLADETYEINKDVSTIKFSEYIKWLGK